MSTVVPNRPKAAPRKDYFRGTYLSTGPIVSKETARAAALAVLHLEQDDTEAHKLIATLGLLDLIRGDE